MNLESVSENQAQVRMDAFEAADLLTSLKQHAEQLGDIGKELIDALEAEGVKVLAEDPHPRSEYLPPRDLHRV